MALRPSRALSSQYPTILDFLRQSDLRYELSFWTSVLHYGTKSRTYIHSSEEKKRYIVYTAYVISHDHLMICELREFTTGLDRDR
jgi:hypothetical protein